MAARFPAFAARAARFVLGLGLLAASILLLARPAPTSRSAARGRVSHAPGGEAVAAGYEVKDLSARGLAFILLGLGSSAAALIGIVFLLLWLFTSWDAREASGFTAEQVATVSPPAPHLQVDAMEDLRRERAREAHALQGYAWLDPGHTRAHVPLARAMALVTGQSLDVAP